MTELADLNDALKRELAVPGTFATAFPDTNAGQLTASLADAFAEAQLDGYFTTMALDPSDYTVDPDLSAAGGAMVTMYAGIRILRAQLRAVGIKGRVRYKAGPVEFEQSPASWLRDDLLALIKRRDELQDIALRATQTYVFDSYVSAVVRSGDVNLLTLGFYDLQALGGFYPYEY